jgi:hypothetical protein
MARPISMRSSDTEPGRGGGLYMCVLTFSYLCVVSESKRTRERH